MSHLRPRTRQDESYTLKIGTRPLLIVGEHDRRGCPHTRLDLGHPALVKRLGQAAHTQALSRFDTAVVMDRYEALIARLTRFSASA